MGDSYDNALAETINGLYKTEVIYRQSWKSREAVEFATLAWVDWVDWVNHRRLLQPMGNIPPAKAEAVYIGNYPSRQLTTISLRDFRGGSDGTVLKIRLDNSTPQASKIH
jgi:hypothetical protein